MRSIAPPRSPAPLATNTAQALVALLILATITVATLSTARPPAPRVSAITVPHRRPAHRERTRDAGGALVDDLGER